MLTKVSIYSALRWYCLHPSPAGASKIGAFTFDARSMAYRLTTDACAEWMLTFVSMTNPV
jgi:hypothetical protein